MTPGDLAATAKAAARALGFEACGVADLASAPAVTAALDAPPAEPEVQFGRAAGAVGLQPRAQSRALSRDRLRGSITEPSGEGMPHPLIVGERPAS